MNFYADTSYLFSLYVADAGSLRALAHRATITDPLPFSLFNRLELHNAVELTIFRKQLTPEKGARVWRNVELDTRSGSLLAVDIDWQIIYRRAESLTIGFTATLGNRSLDVLQVAVALSIGAREFLTFDHRQRALAQAAGLLVQP